MRRLILRARRVALRSVSVLIEGDTRTGAEQVPDEDPAELTREVLRIEKEIIGGLEKLLREIQA